MPSDATLPTRRDTLRTLTSGEELEQFIGAQRGATPSELWRLVASDATPALLGQATVMRDLERAGPDAWRPCLQRSDCPSALRCRLIDAAIEALESGQWYPQQNTLTALLREAVRRGDIPLGGPVYEAWLRALDGESGDDGRQWRHAQLLVHFPGLPLAVARRIVEAGQTALGHYAVWHAEADVELWRAVARQGLPPATVEAFVQRHAPLSDPEVWGALRRHARGALSRALAAVLDPDLYGDDAPDPDLTSRPPDEAHARDYLLRLLEVHPEWAREAYARRPWRYDLAPADLMPLMQHPESGVRAGAVQMMGVLHERSATPQGPLFTGVLE